MIFAIIYGVAIICGFVLAMHALSYVLMGACMGTARVIDSITNPTKRISQFFLTVKLSILFAMIAMIGVIIANYT